MLFFLPPSIRGVLVFLIYVIYTLVLCLIFFLIAIVKMVPIHSVRIWCTKVLNGISNIWIICSIYTHRFVGSGIQWKTRGVDDLCMEKWCLLTSNHQTWADIIILVQVLYGRVPPFKFFIKQELLFLPFMGLALWGLEFPIMKRYSRQFLEKHPHLKGKDLETTRRSCEKFKKTPVSIMNFVEGTRYTQQKHHRQQSPFAHLLKPKAGGVAMVLYAMGEYLEDMIDLTIAYPDGVPTLWQFFCGRPWTIEIDVQVLQIPEDIRKGDYFEDPDFREHFRKWLNDFWMAKDRKLDKLLSRETSAR